MIYFFCGLLFFCLFAIITVFVISRRNTDADKRIAAILASASAAEPVVLLGPWLRTTRTIRKALGLKETATLRQSLLQAGCRDSEHVEFYFAARLLLPLLLGGLMAVVDLDFIPITVGLLFGYLAPDYILRFMAKARITRIRRAMPDVVDLLVICIDAGLGLEQAIKRVTDEMTAQFPDLFEEVAIVIRDQTAGLPKAQAWAGMVTRAKCPEVESFVSMLMQAERFGTPISHALTTFSDDLRNQRKQYAEERAAKSTVKLLIPLVVFIFPAVFVVLLGPALIELMHGFGSMGKP